MRPSRGFQLHSGVEENNRIPRRQSECGWKHLGDVLSALGSLQPWGFPYLGQSDVGQFLGSVKHALQGEKCASLGSI